MDQRQLESYLIFKNTNLWKKRWAISNFWLFRIIKFIHFEINFFSWMASMELFLIIKKVVKPHLLKKLTRIGKIKKIWKSLDQFSNPKLFHIEDFYAFLSTGPRRCPEKIWWAYVTHLYILHYTKFSLSWPIWVLEFGVPWGSGIKLAVSCLY